ncbi:PAS domain S-box protein [Desulfomonile tiedjei]|uniref:histidine kinase n=1 Tax=Desulfomonile tiedjei (strain ATCC 49306 / DSM 6799 / DCB-1) TaxID=706587 RepID=I4C9B2_DESTA|nr:PAS domain S-box protein [Desulfomonile tiedjei]AFM26153.1 PAS domain S-box [Desulfomonile tiedjei DSM 6799]
MTIKRRILITSIFFIVLMLIIGSILFWNSHEVRKGIRQSGITSEVVRSAFLMKSFMDEYLTHAGSRPLRQWIKQNEVLGKIIDDAKADSSFDRVLLRDLADKYRDVNSAYRQIVEVGKNTDHYLDLKLLKETLSGMVSVRLEELVNAAERLDRATRSQMLQKQRITEVSVLIAFLTMIGIIILNLLLIRKAVLSPIQELSRGAEIIGSGDFDHSIVTNSRDEIGVLAQTFNGMVRRLRQSYDSLQAEIEERKRAEQTVVAERKRLYDMLETMPVMVCLLTPDFHIAFANRSFREKFPDEKGRKCFEYRFNREEPCDFCAACNVLETGEPHQWESMAPDGSIIEGFKYPFTDVDGSPLILEIGIDITERREAEQIREKSLENAAILSRVFSTTHFSLVYLDKEFNFIQVNKAYADACGYPPEYFPGKNHFDLYPHEENESIFRRVVETGEAFTVYAKPFDFPDDPDRGTTYWDWSLYPIKDADGQVEGLVFILLDVTDRHKVEEALQAASAYNRSLIEASLDPLVTISPKGIITDVNTATEKVTGFSREELVGTNFSDYFTDPEKAREGYETVFRDGLVSDYELELQHRYGGTVPVMYNASLYRDMYGSIVGVFAAARNVSERKKAEEELLRSNKDLEQFAYVASHDLQEPLRNIAGCMQMLERKYQTRLDSDAIQYIHYAVDSAVRMKTLILDLLTYSRVGTRGKPPKLTDCGQILAEALNNLKTIISDTGAIITHDPLPTVTSDETQLLQVFQNLIANAIKFRKKDVAPHIHISAVKNRNNWIFSVKDNGIGIDSQYLDRIFVIFQRLNKRSEYEGSGMGLAIVKKVVERHGGRVWAESEPDVGTTLYFTIPKRGLQV